MNPDLSNNELADRIKTLAYECGYADCGITTAEPFTEFKTALEKRMERFPESAHHYEKMINRIDPRTNSPWANSIVVCVMHYGRYEIPEKLNGRIGKHYQFDRRYAGCPDHETPKQFKQKLKELGLRVKKGGTPDRWAGVRAGVVQFGKNNFVFSEKHGSWINIEPWLVDAELPPDEPSFDVPCPENCTACINACPTGALSEPFSMCMDRCIAYLSYSGPGPADQETEKLMSEWIYGCDICQDVCPRNKGKWENREKAQWLEKALDYLMPEALASMDMKTYKDIVHPLFWYITDDEEGLERWHCNAKRSIKNSQ